MSTEILDRINRIEELRKAQEPLLRALRLYGEVQRAGYPPTAETVKDAKLIPYVTPRQKTREREGIERAPKGLIAGIELASGASITFPEPIQYP